VDYDGELLDAHFCTGDGRGNENIALTAVHTVFHSEHNRLANQIGGPTGVGGLIDTLLTAEEAAAWRAVDPASGWDYGERVFQAARFVTEMQYQHLVFEEFARTVSPSINEFIGDGINFTSHLDPSIVAEFAHAVYRFGHSMLTETISRTLPDGTQVDIPLLEGFLNPRAFNNVAGQTLTAEQAAGAIFQGGIRQVANEIDEFKTEALRNNLLGLPLDLAAINIARGRSEGVAPLNVVRQQLFAATSDFALRPYDSWADFGFSMRYPESLTNFVAAYGTHPTITAETTIAGRRAAAQALIDAGDPWLFEPAAETGLNDVDLWMGGLAERPSPFGGVLGSTFNFIFEHQLEALQNADRFYYLERLDGLNLLAQLEGNSFAELISRNTTATGMAQLVFARPDLVFNLDRIDGGFDAEANRFLIADDPTTLEDESTMADLIRTPNGSFRYLGPAHVIWNGTANADRVTSSEGDDTFNGGNGVDRFEGGAGNDSPVGGDGDDVLTDVFGDDVMKGGPGNDAISGGSGPFDLLQGNEGDDFIVGGNDVSEIFGGSGDDVFYAGVGATEVFGGAGDDWFEGTDSPASVLVGDENNQFQNDPNGGHDVIIAGPGDADFDSEGGDDIMVANVTPTHRLEGMLGYDFAIYAGETVPVDADMLITGAVAVNAPLNENRDRYDLTEGLSGTNFNDLLRGDHRAEADLRDDGLTGVLNGHVLTSAGIARIRGLADLLPAGTTEVAGGNIILGGPGSDLLEGRGGNDILDGDAWLNVQLVATLNDGTIVRANRLNTLRPHVFSDPQRLNPGNIDIDRFIVTGDANAGDVDIAVFSGPRADYTISANEDGSFTVAHQGGTGLDGTDRVRNVEILRFTDMDVSTTGVAGGLTVPNLFGMTEADARTTIQALGLNVGTVNPNGVHPTAAIGSVVEQDPVAGAGIAVGGTVNITLTRGALVPDIHESTVAAGTATLEAGGFVVAGTTEINDPEIPAGLVASTNPVAGEIIPPGSNVIINVSLGPVAAGVVPAVEGLPQADAEEAILNAGFTVAAVARFETSATIPAGSAIRTIPAAGTALAAGSTVTPVISTGTDGLVLALGFDEANGTVAIDSSVVARNGTLRQATMTRAPGRFGNAVVFDGANDWVTVTDTTNSPLDLRNAMTIEAWVNPTALSGWETVVLKERAGGLTYALYAHDGAPLTDGTAVPAGYNRIGIEDRRIGGTSALALNTWTHLALTYDGQNQRLYVNGVLVQTRAQTGLNIQNNGALRIGGNNQFVNEFFSGMIDEVRIYQTVRTQEQIQSDMTRPINP
jgi:beta-lactam-binding protein with PASTA domain